MFTFSLLVAVQANVPFSEWFDIEPVESYHKALPLEDFMAQLAPQHWPEGQRIGYCYRLAYLPTTLVDIGRLCCISCKCV